MFASKKIKTPTIKGVVYKQGIMAGFKAKSKCHICSDITNDIVCSRCMKSGLFISQYEIECKKLRDIEDVKLKNDNACRTCKISEEKSTDNCRNDSCSIYFDRMQVKVNYETQVKKVDKMNNVLVKCI